MRFWILIFLISTSLPLYSQVEISNKNFNYFDLMEIENNDHQSLLQVSASFDEIGYNLEYYRIKKRFLSFNINTSFKRLLSNFADIWVPETIRWQKLFPKNGIEIGFGGRWFFNHRKFSFVGLKLFSGYHWTNAQKMRSEINLQYTSPTIDQLFKTRNFRWGLNGLVGRKFSNKLLSEIQIELGYRWDKSLVQFQCYSNCQTGLESTIYTQKNLMGILHFQVILGFNLFSK